MIESYDYSCFTSLLRLKVGSFKMPIEIVKDQIRKFIKEEDASVIAIKGDWGVGKTYCWNELLQQAKDKEAIGLEKYSYVSLFGVDSLDALKFDVFQNTDNFALTGEEDNFEKAVKNPLEYTTSLLRKGFGPASILLSNQVSVPHESIAFSMVSDTLICIDDLERRGKNLSLKDVLGLVSVLKEQKNCKVVLLLNDGEQGVEHYLKYAEKVVDIELAFSPTADECAIIAFDNTNDEYELLKESTIKLNIRNIRILKKIEKLLLSVQPLLQEAEVEVKNQFVKSLVLFCWSHTCSSNDEKIPIYRYLRYRHRRQQSHEMNNSWESILTDYGQDFMDDLDRLIAKSVSDGYFVEEELLAELGKRNELVIAENSRGAFTEAWQLFHHHFDVDADVLVGKLFESYKTNVQYIGILKLNATVELFRLLEENEKASEMIDMYIEYFADSPESFDLSEVIHHTKSKDMDSELVQKIDGKFLEVSLEKEGVEQVIRRIQETNSWKSSDVIVLAYTSDKEYYQLFKESLKGECLPSYMRQCTEFPKGTGSDEQVEAIRKNSKEALSKIASESTLNQHRIERHRIKL